MGESEPLSRPSARVQVLGLGQAGRAGTNGGESRKSSLSMYSTEMCSILPAYQESYEKVSGHKCQISTQSQHTVSYGTRYIPGTRTCNHNNIINLPTCTLVLFKSEYSITRTCSRFVCVHRAST